MATKKSSKKNLNIKAAKPVKKASPKPKQNEITPAKTAGYSVKLKGLKLVYLFGGKKAEGTGIMKDLLGGKGAGLAEMTNIGVPVPPGFTITTEVCKLYYQNNMTAQRT